MLKISLVFLAFAILALTRGLGVWGENPSFTAMVLFTIFGIIAGVFFYCNVSRRLDN